MANELAVMVEGKPAGILVRENHEYLFQYDAAASPNEFVSLTMPVRRKEYAHPALHPIFEMHLPEGYLLSVIKKHFAKVVNTDDFGLLKLLAPNVRGRLEYNRSDAPAPDTLSLEDLLHPSSPELFDELVQRFALRSALSGVQPKVLAQIENKATLKLEEYIVKTWGSDYPSLALNEYCCMLALKQAGIPVPEFHLSDDESLFIMKRFDLRDNGQPLGFEDLCVLQAKQRDDKYTGSYEQVAKSIKTFTSPRHKVHSLQQFFKMMVLNNRLQNGDAHLKNFGVVYEGTQSVRLAPAYDVVCTTAYIQKDIAALTLMGSKKWWPREALERFGQQACDLTKAQTRQLYDECLHGLQHAHGYITRRLTESLNDDQMRVLRHLERLTATETRS